MDDWSKLVILSVDARMLPKSETKLLTPPHTTSSQSRALLDIPLFRRFPPNYLMLH